MSKAIPQSLLKLILLVLCGGGLIFGNLSAYAGDIVTYIHTDINGNPVAKTDSTGDVIWRQSYTPYGETDQQADPDGPGYTGHRHDAATGLVYMQARYYDPKIGRFLSPDPVTFSPQRPGYFNRYWYAKGNPYKYTDPDGRCVDGFGCGALAQSFGGNPEAAKPLVPYAAAGAAVMLAASGLPELAGLVRVVLKIGKTSESPAGGAMARGKVSEAKVLKDMGLSKNTQSVSTAEGKSIPDALTPTRSVEVKDTASVSNTKQVRIQTEAAKQSGRQSELVTGTKTHVSGKAQESFDKITRRDDLGPQG